MNVSDIADCVDRHPGIHFNRLVEELDSTPEALSRVRDRLEGETNVTSAFYYGQTHFYPASFNQWEQRALALLRRETSREIVTYLLESDASTPGAVAQEVGIARSTLEWHLDRLIEANLVEKNADTWPRELSVVDPPAVVALLEALEPSLSDRWLDRTTRLVDHLLEE